ncbi:MAG: DUF5119 domain-containing protein [Alistipes sp.]|nr:DUF5119 domain-containing protein [Alistipes sp.]
MSRVRYILLVALVALVSVACQRRPMEEHYMRVYLNLEIDKDVVNYEVKDKEPGLMRVVFFDSMTGRYLSHDFVPHTGGYIFAPYGDVDMVLYNLEAGETRIRNYYVWSDIEAYTNEISEQQRSRFTRYLQSRGETRPSYDDIRVTPGHLFVASERGLHIPRYYDGVYIINATAKTVVESWTVEVEGIEGMEWVGSIAMMLSGQVGSNFIATNTRSTEPLAIYFDIFSAQRRSTVLESRFETFGRELTSGDVALLSILFTDTQGHPYMYNFDVSEQMVNNPKQHIYINADINIPKPEIGSGFRPEVEGWKEYEYDIDI